MESLVPHQGEKELHLSLEELTFRMDPELETGEFFRRAERSALYGPRWMAAGVNTAQLRGRNTLRHLPYTESRHLVALQGSSAGLRKMVLTRPRIWVTSRGVPPGVKKWMPLTLSDIAHWFSRAQRVLELVAASNAEMDSTLFLVMNEAMPQVSNALPYFWERADYLAGSRRFEFIIAATSMLWRNHWDRFALKKHPQWLAGSVADARSLAMEMGNEVHSLMKPPRLGIFWGEPLGGTGGLGGSQALATRAELEEVFELSESFSLYFSAECREMYIECPAHAGLHLWMDGAIHEILPDGEERTGVGSLFVDEAPEGMEGEYVVTTLGEALPLIRYRTGDRIRVISTEPCSCGITHPRVLFLGRI